MMWSNAMFAMAAFKNVLHTGLVAIFVMAVVRICVFVVAPVAVFVFVVAPVPVFVMPLFVMVAVFAVTVAIIRIIPVAVSVTAIAIAVGICGRSFSILQNPIRFLKGRFSPGIGFGNSPFGLLLLLLQKAFSLGQFLSGNFQSLRLLALDIRFFIIRDFRCPHEEPCVFGRCIIGKMVYTIFICPVINVRIDC